MGDDFEEMAKAFFWLLVVIGLAVFFVASTHEKPPASVPVPHPHQRERLEHQAP